METKTNLETLYANSRQFAFYVYNLLKTQWLKLVEAAGVEPASENVTGKETTCLVAFPLPYFYGNFRDRRSERTRNASR